MKRLPACLWNLAGALLLAVAALVLFCAMGDVEPYRDLTDAGPRPAPLRCGDGKCPTDHTFR